MREPHKWLFGNKAIRSETQWRLLLTQSIGESRRVFFWDSPCKMSSFSSEWRMAWGWVLLPASVSYFLFPLSMLTCPFEPYSVELQLPLYSMLMVTKQQINIYRQRDAESQCRVSEKEYEKGERTKMTVKEMESDGQKREWEREVLLPWVSFCRITVLHWGRERERVCVSHFEGIMHSYTCSPSLCSPHYILILSQTAGGGACPNLTLSRLLMMSHSWGVM